MHNGNVGYNGDSSQDVYENEVYKQENPDQVASGQTLRRIQGEVHQVTQRR